MYRQNANALLNGRKNICGVGIKKLRKTRGTKFSQADLATEMQRKGMECDKNMIQKIESGDRYVTDFELRVFAEIFDVTMEELVDMFDDEEEP